MREFQYRVKAAVLASGIHFGLSVLVAGLAAVLVFVIWYPFPYRDLMGGKELFFLIASVDVICGPLLTLILYNPSKSKAELSRDLGLVVAIQVAALLYGLHTVMIARPVYLVFETDRFNAVSAIQIDEKVLANAPEPWDQLPMWGPHIVAAREPRDGDDRLKSLDLSLQGIEPSMRPDWWQPLEASRTQVLQRAQSVEILRKKYATNLGNLEKIKKAIDQTGKKEDELLWLPLTSSRDKNWTVFIDAKTIWPLAYAAVDGF
jgi:hypothetical protein